MPSSTCGSILVIPRMIPPLANVASGDPLGAVPSPLSVPYRNRVRRVFGVLIIKAQAYGTVNSQTGEFGLRNEGIRAYDAEAGELRFWEFDVFGGITAG